MNGYYTFRGRQRLGSGVKWLIIACVSVFILQIIFPNLTLRLFALSRSDVVGRLWLWQPVTYIFLHGGFIHLFFNMFVLWMFGRVLEQLWGTKEFLKFFFISGIGAGITCIIFSSYPTIGASGAIYGLLAAYGIIFPEQYIYLYFFFPIKSKYFVILFAVLEFFASFSSSRDGIAHFAHLGGMLFGVVYLLIRQKVFRKRLGKVIQFPKHPESISDEEIDRILDKISHQGIGSLTKEEQRALYYFGKKLKRRR